MMRHKFVGFLLIVALLLIPPMSVGATGNESTGEVLVPSEEEVNDYSPEDAPGGSEEGNEFPEVPDTAVIPGNNLVGEQEKNQEIVPAEEKSKIDKTVKIVSDVEEKNGPLSAGGMQDYTWSYYSSARMMTSTEQPLLYRNGRSMNGGNTYYPYTSGYLYIEVQKDGAIGIYRLDCWLEYQTWSGGQQIYYSISHISGVDFGVSIAPGPYYTQADGVGGTDGWLVEERQYSFPIQLDFTNYSGYQLCYNISDSDLTQFYGGVYGNSLSAVYTTNCVGITNWWDGVNFLHDTIRVYYQKNTYTLLYEGNGATSGSIPSQSIKYGDGFDVKNGFSRLGHSLKGYAAVRVSDNAAYCASFGWQSLSSAIGANPDYWGMFQPGRADSINEYWINAGVKDDTFKFYAQWQPNTYTIRFDGNGATSGSMSPSNLKYGGSFTVTNGYVKTGYTFKGFAAVRSSDNAVYCGGYGWQSRFSVVGSNPINWKMYTSGSLCTMNEYWINSNAVNDTFTFQAQWTANTYTVQFNGNGATGGATGTKPAIYDTAVTLTANGFSKTGHTFTGWNTKADGSGAKYNNSAAVINLTSINNGTVTLYAQWQRNKYKVTYNYSYNGGDSSTANSTEVYYEYAVDLSSVAVKSGDTGTYSAENTDGWQFIGWNTDMSATSGLSSLNMGTNDVALYAIFKKIVTATYVDYVENTRKETKIVKTVYNRNTSADCSNNAKNTINGWTHGGWCTGTNPTSATISNLTINKDTVFYGKYFRVLTERFVNFKTVTDLTGNQYCNSYAIGVRSNVNLSTPLIQNKASWTSLGWASDNAADSKTVYTANQAVAFTESGTYYAIYNRVYTVSYDANGGTSTPADVKVTALYNASGSAYYPEIKVASPIVKYGTDFKNWNTSNNGGGKDYKAESTLEVSSDLKLFAKFEDTQGSSIELSKEKVVIKVGEKVDVGAAVKPDNSKHNSFSWESTDGKIATVNNGGTIIGNSAGKTTVIVKANSEDSITALVEVTVVGCTVKVPATMVLGTPTILSVSVNSNTAAGKKASLIMYEMTNLKGVSNGKEYELKAEISDNNEAYAEAAIGDSVIETNDTKAVFFKVTPLVSTNSLAADSYTASIKFRLEFK